MRGGDIEQAVADGVEPDKIERWARAMVTEELIVQRILNAARWVEAQTERSR